MGRKKDNHLRFGVSDNNGHRAATWTVTNPKEKSDIYIACRELGGQIKASLHESGSWHVGFNAEASNKYFKGEGLKEGGEGNKYMEIWAKPPDIAPDQVPGLTLALRIVTPHSSVTVPNTETKKDIVWIPNCEEGYSTNVFLFTSYHPFYPNDWPGKTSLNTKFIGSFIVSSGDTCCLVYSQNPSQVITRQKGNNFRFLGESTIDDLRGDNLRAFAFGQEPDGSRVIVDLIARLPE